MKSMFTRLWKDEAGIVALEYLLVATILGLGLIAGLAGLRNALDSELLELGEAITGLDHDYYITGVAHENSGTGDSDVADTTSEQLTLTWIGETTILGDGLATVDVDATP